MVKSDSKKPNRWADFRGFQKAANTAILSSFCDEIFQWVNVAYIIALSYSINHLIGITKVTISTQQNLDEKPKS